MVWFYLSRANWLEMGVSRIETGEFLQLLVDAVNHSKREG